jgi:hypothetical protein
VLDGIDAISSWAGDAIDLRAWLRDAEAPDLAWFSHRPPG